MALHILVGGEAHILQGVERSKREFLHTSTTFIGEAYEALRASGVPRARIVVIAQVDDYLETLRMGEKGGFENGIPPRYYTDMRSRVEARCRRLIDEGGAHYDHKDVNPATLWKTLSTIPKGATGVHLAVYSHGNSYQTVEGETDNPNNHEWYFNMPYEAPPDAREWYSFVAIEKATQPFCNVYMTHLRMMFQRLFAEDPSRPILCLLNCCRSGGLLTALERGRLGEAKWPLFVISSSQATKDSLVSGMWSAWFATLTKLLKERSSCELVAAYEAAEDKYYADNVFELTNHIKERAYSREIFSLDFVFEGRQAGSIDPWHLDLTAALTAHNRENRVRKLQESYRSGAAFKIVPKGSYTYGHAELSPSHDVVWTNHSSYKPVKNMRPYPTKLTAWQGPNACKEVDLWEEVRQSLDEDIACPSYTHGKETGIAAADVLLWS